MCSLVSKFLPNAFQANEKVALLGGRGIYPALLWNRLSSNGINAHLIAFENETSTELFSSVPENRRTFLNVGQIGKLLKTLEMIEARYVLMAGQITPGKLFKDLKPDLKAIWMLACLKERNAATIFGSIVTEIESLGISVLDARSFLDDQLAERKLMTKGRMVVSESELNHGTNIAKEVAGLDIGQGIVVSKGTVIAVEAFEGTDAMLERAGKLCSKKMGFIKTSKQNQDFRFDVPVFGTRTLEKMRDANIQWAALESEKTLMLEKDIIISRANQYGISIIGF